MGLDEFGNNRLSCKIEDCDCPEFLLDTPTGKCRHCGDFAAKHVRDEVAAVDRTLPAGGCQEAELEAAKRLRLPLDSATTTWITPTSPSNITTLTTPTSPNISTSSSTQAAGCSAELRDRRDGCGHCESD